MTGGPGVAIIAFAIIWICGTGVLPAASQAEWGDYVTEFNQDDVVTLTGDAFVCSETDVQLQSGNSVTIIGEAVNIDRPSVDGSDRRCLYLEDGDGSENIVIRNFYFNGGALPSSLFSFDSPNSVTFEDCTFDAIDGLTDPIIRVFNGGSVSFVNVEVVNLITGSNQVSWFQAIDVNSVIMTGVRGHNTMPSMGPFQVALIRLVTTGDAPSLTVTDCHFNDTDGIEAAVFAIDGAWDVAIDDSVFAHNAVAPVHAFNADFNLSITNSYFLDNRDKGVWTEYGHSVEFRETTFRDHYSSGDGGAICDDGSEHILIADSTFAGNTAANRGGSVHLELQDTSVAATITDSSFDSSTAETSHGGSVSMAGSAMTNTEIVMERLTVSRSRSESGRGGGIFLYEASTARLEDVTVSAATTENRYGSCAHIDRVRTSVDIIRLICRDSIAGNGGNGVGALSIAVTGVANVRDSVFVNNTGNKAGGFFLNAITAAEVDNVTITDVTSFGDGGGFLTDAIPTLTMANLHLTNVVSTGGDYGGGRVVVQMNSSVSLSDSSFVDCTAGRGGGLGLFWNNGMGNGRVAALNAVEFRRCTARFNGDGGGMFVRSLDSLQLTGVTAVDCLAQGDGGFLLTEDVPLLRISDSTFTTNTAWQEGGVAYVHASNQFKVEGETTVAMNNASTGAGFILRGQSHGEFNGATFNGNFEAPIVVGNGSSADITGCLFADNLPGGALFEPGSVGSLEDTDFATMGWGYACADASGGDRASVTRSAGVTHCDAPFACDACQDSPGPDNDPFTCCGDSCPNEVISCEPICNNDIDVDATDSWYVDKEGICRMCPSGAVDCGLGRSSFLPAPGFWQANVTTMPLKCYATSETLAAIRCPGFAYMSCGVGYVNTSARCAACADGFYLNDFGLCIPCEATDWWLVVIAVVLLIVFTVFVAVYAKRLRDYTGGLTLAVAYIQVLALLYQSYLRWPQKVQRLWFTFSLSNLNVNLFKAECSVSLFKSYSAKWVLQASLPLLFALICGLIIACIYLHTWVVHKNDVRLRLRYPDLYARRGTDGDDWDDSLDGYDESCCRACRRCCFVARTPSELETINTGVLSGFLTFASFAYISLAELSMKNFACNTVTEDNVDVLYLAADPTILCRDPWWYQLLPFSVISLVVYVFGIPIFFGVLLVRNSYKIRLKDSGAKSSLGILFYRYRPERWYWELVVLARKVAIVAIFLFVSGYDQAVTMVSLVMIVLALALVAQLVARPYAAKRHNVIEAVLMVVTILIFMLGIVSYKSYPGDNDDGADQLPVRVFVAIAVFTLVLPALIAVVVLIAMDVRDVRAQRQAGASKRRSVRASRRMEPLRDLGPDEADAFGKTLEVDDAAVVGDGPATENTVFGMDDDDES